MQKQPLFRSLLSGLLLLTSTTLFAAQQQELPTRASLDNKLTSLNKRDTLTVTEKAQKDDIEQTISLLDSIEKEKIKAKDQDQSLTRTPAKLKEYTRQLELLQKNDAQDTEALKTEISRLSQTQLDSRLTDLLSQLQSAQSDFAFRVVHIVERFGRQGDFQAQIGLAHRRYRWVERAVGVAMVDVLDVDAACTCALLHQHREQIHGRYFALADAAVLLVLLVQALKFVLVGKESIVQTRHIRR